MVNLHQIFLEIKVLEIINLNEKLLLQKELHMNLMVHCDQFEFDIDLEAI